MNLIAPRENMSGGAWLVADMSLNIWALSIVKWLGAGYPASQVVFVRALVGLFLLLPLIWHQRHLFRQVEDLGLHLLRIGLSVVTLTASFFAISRVPLAVFTAVGFTRPIVTMLMAAGLLKEPIGRTQWAAAAVALIGVLIAVQPGAVPWSLGLAALALVVLTGSAAVIATRRLRAAPTIVMMTFYTAGLTACVAPFAMLAWTPINAGHLVPLLLVGVFSQCAQLCFLRAHFYGEAGFLSVLGYLSLVLSVGVGILVFEEQPDLGFYVGATLVLVAVTWVTFLKTLTASQKRGSQT